MDKGKLKPLTGLKLKKAARTLATLGLSVVLMLGATFGISSCAPKISSPSGQTPPITPVEPNQPNTPSQPSAPVEPENPGSTQTPENPQNPSTPSQPDDPVEPNNPDTPQNPDDPTTPENPTNPDNPQNPDDENPDNPQNPDQPDNPDDPGKQPEEQKPIEPEFELNAQTKAVIAEKLKPTMEKICEKTRLGFSNPVLAQAYLRQSDGALYDTLGCVMLTDNKKTIFYSEIKVLNLQESLTWETLSKEGIKIETYNSKTCKITSIYHSSDLIDNLSNYDSSYREAAFMKTFGLSKDEYNSLLFTGWTYSGGILDSNHRFTYIKDNIIYQKYIKVNNIEQTLFGSFVTNFLESTQNDQWRELEYTQTTLIPESYLPNLVDFTNQENEAETV